MSSTIINNVLDHCAPKSTFAAVYFYFDFNDVEKQHPEKMIRSLVMQLSAQSKSSTKLLKSLFSSCLDGERQPDPDTLLRTLRQMVDQFDEVFIILDALDECMKRELREVLLENIMEIAGWKLGKLHILATSRSEIDIEEHLSHFVNDQEKVRIQSARINDDIRAYIREKLQNDHRLKRWKQASDEIEMTLMSKANEM